MLAQPRIFLILAALVSAPAVLTGQLFRQGDHMRAMQVAFAEVLVILIAAAITRERSRD